MDKGRSAKKSLDNSIGLQQLGFIQRASLHESESDAAEKLEPNERIAITFGRVSIGGMNERSVTNSYDLTMRIFDDSTRFKIVSHLYLGKKRYKLIILV